MKTNKEFIDLASYLTNDSDFLKARDSLASQNTYSELKKEPSHMFGIELSETELDDFNNTILPTLKEK